jgi:hypothetical protein
VGRGVLSQELWIEIVYIIDIVDLKKGQNASFLIDDILHFSHFLASEKTSFLMIYKKNDISDTGSGSFYSNGQNNTRDYSIYNPVNLITDSKNIFVADVEANDNNEHND